ncbi:MAG: hypothetical protein ABIP13_00440, partial [Tepidiformaceae bacterium]
VYGFDMAGFETEFLAAQGSSAPRATVAPTTRPQQAQPTSAPTKAPAAAQAQSTKTGDSGISTASKVIVGTAILFALLAVLSFLMLQMMANNRKSASANAASHHPEERGPD